MPSMEALYNILTGKVMPSGKTPITFPKMVGQIPLYYNRHIVNDQMVNSRTVSCTIKNTGSYDAYETPQLYVRQLSGDLVRPLCELKGFQKIFIPAGETREVSFTLTDEDLGYWHEPHDGLSSRVWFTTDSTSFRFAILPYSQPL